MALPINYIYLRHIIKTAFQATFSTILPILLIFLHLVLLMSANGSEWERSVPRI